MMNRMIEWYRTYRFNKRWKKLQPSLQQQYNPQFPPDAYTRRGIGLDF